MPFPGIVFESSAGNFRQDDRSVHFIFPIQNFSALTYFPSQLSPFKRGWRFQISMAFERLDRCSRLRGKKGLSLQLFNKEPAILDLDVMKETWFPKKYFFIEKGDLK